MSLCLSQTPPSFPEIPAHPSPLKYPCFIQISSWSHCLLSLLSLVSEFSRKESRALASSGWSVVLLFFLSSLWAGILNTEPRRGREEERQ